MSKSLLPAAAALVAALTLGGAAMADTTTGVVKKMTSWSIELENGVFFSSLPERIKDVKVGDRVEIEHFPVVDDTDEIAKVRVLQPATRTN